MSTYSEIYTQNAAMIARHSAGGLNRYREQLYERWSNTGFPTRKTENYRSIDLTEPLSVDYGLNLSRVQIPTDPARLFHCDVPDVSDNIHFVVNDQYYDRPDEPVGELPQGVVVCSMRRACEQYGPLIDAYLSRLVMRFDDPIANFNGAFAQDGLFVYVPDGVRLDRPIQLINIMHAGGPLMANAHNLVVLGNDAYAQLLVCDHCMEQNIRFCATRTTEVFLGQRASYEHYKLENTSTQMCSLNNLLVSQAEGSRFLGNIITLHNGVTRNNISIDQDGPGCDTHLCGMATLDGTQQVDNFSSIHHLHPQGTSNELFKYILDDSSRGVFMGRLKVMPGAQKTEAFQTNRNILLTDTAQVRTKPQLEIYADDVKCSHGATTGQLDEQALFYMRQRGIGEHEAKMLLMQAFVSDVTNNIRIPSLHERITLLVENRLRGNRPTAGHACISNACGGCALADRKNKQ
ncbi:MAG: Fe-S cluster assembly protein SufD [Paludibacteraceae bacterium]|nr:Fe-S cluster assembly protein SufD [Paludibacteraceae bacterium]